MALYTKRTAPGVYIEHFRQAKSPVTYKGMRLEIGVQGLCRKGRIDKPMYVTENSYLQLLGTHLTANSTLTNGDYGDLMYELDQYFANAPVGAGIWVKRIVNTNNPPDSASHTVTDGTASLFDIQAKNQGEWGNWLKIVLTSNNRIEVSDGYTCAASTVSTKILNLDSGTTNAIVFKAGDRVKITVSGTDYYYNVREVDMDKNCLYLYEPLVAATSGGESISTVDFDIAVYDTNPDVPIELRDSEYWTQMNQNPYGSNYVETVINDDNYPATTGSNMISIGNILSITSSTPPPVAITDASNTLLAGGSDGANIDDNDWKDLAGSWNGYKVTVLANLGHYDPLVSGHNGGDDTVGNKDFCCKPNIIKAALSYMDDNITNPRYWIGGFVFCPPITEAFSSKDDNLSAARQVKAWRFSLGINDRHAKLYDTYYDIRDEIEGMGPNPTKKMSPLGAVLGIYKRYAEYGLHVAPAGVAASTETLDAEVKNALELYMPTDQDSYRSVTFPFDINSFATTSTKIVVYGDKTLITDKTWKQVNYSLYMASIEQELHDAFEWVPFKPDSVETYNAVKEQLSSFFATYAKQGHYKTSKENPKGYYFKVLNLDPELKDSIENHYIVVEFGVSLYDAVNFFIIRSSLMTSETS